MTRMKRVFSLTFCRYKRITRSTPFVISRTMTVSSTVPRLPAHIETLQLPQVTAPLDKNIRELAAVAASRDFRSDVVTTPTAAIGREMAAAAGYDNVYGVSLTQQ